MLAYAKKRGKKNKLKPEQETEEDIEMRMAKEERQRKINENKRAYKNKLAQKKRAYIEGNECKDTGLASDKCRAVRPDGVFLGRNRSLIDAGMDSYMMMEHVGHGGDIPAFSVNTESHFLVDVINSIFKTIGDIEDDDETVIRSLNGEKLNALFRELDYSIFWNEFNVGRRSGAEPCPLGNMQFINKVTKGVDCKHGLEHIHKDKYNKLLSAYLDSIILILKNSNVREIPQKEYFSALFNLIKKIMMATGTNIMEVNIDKWREFSQKINEIYSYNIFNISCSKGEDDYTCGRGINSAEEGGKNYILLFDTVATNDDTMNMITWALWSDKTFHTGAWRDENGSGGGEESKRGGKRRRTKKYRKKRKTRKRNKSRKYIKQTL